MSVILRTVKTSCPTGPTLLFYDGGDRVQTVEALCSLLPWLRAHGHTLQLSGVLSSSAGASVETMKGVHRVSRQARRPVASGPGLPRPVHLPGAAPDVLTCFGRSSNVRMSCRARSLALGGTACTAPDARLPAGRGATTQFDLPDS